MGQEISSHRFTDADYKRFRERLLINLEGLKALLARPGFGEGETTLGAELELYLVDPHARPLLLNREVIERSGDRQLALELNRFNLEYNLKPVLAAGRPFSQLETEMLAAIQMINQHLQEEQGSALPIGILPTLRRSDFGLHAMTDESRFYALSQALIEMRGRMFCVRIAGDPPISLRSNDVTLEGANTSLQVHMRVEPKAFADTFNALQLVTPVVLAISSNSPFMLRHKLWHETRIPLFRQTIDGRSHEACDHALPSRVDFGSGWVREGAYELFAEMIHLHEPIIPVSGEEDVIGLIAKGRVPELDELRLHSGTVWPWNRAVYDPNQGGHLRIELRALPAGPTVTDMAANAAFAIGLAVGLKDRINEFIPALPFQVLENNFYLAAERGLNAELMWPGLEQPAGLQKRAVADLARELLPLADVGLARIGVEEVERAHYLGVISRRLESGLTGAIWQRREYQRLCRKMSESQALTQMTQRYMRYCAANQPVSEWSNRADRDS